MAKVVTTSLQDDLDGTPAAETVRFALDGKNYEIDLSKSNASKLRKALEPYGAVARRAGGSTGKGAAKARTREFDPAEVRAWAKSKRIKLADRGRIPAAIVERFQAEA